MYVNCEKYVMDELLVLVVIIVSLQVMMFSNTQLNNKFVNTYFPHFFKKLWKWRVSQFCVDQSIRMHIVCVCVCVMNYTVFKKNCGPELWR